MIWHCVELCLLYQLLLRAIVTGTAQQTYFITIHS